MCVNAGSPLPHFHCTSPTTWLSDFGCCGWMDSLPFQLQSINLVSSFHCTIYYIDFGWISYHKLCDLCPWTFISICFLCLICCGWMDSRDERLFLYESDTFSVFGLRTTYSPPYCLNSSAFRIVKFNTTHTKRRSNDVYEVNTCVFFVNWESKKGVHCHHMIIVSGADIVILFFFFLNLNV